MVWHDHVGVKLIIVKVSVFNGIYHHLRDFRHAKKAGTGACVIQDTIHGGEGLSRGDRHQKFAIWRPAAMQAPGNEDGQTERIVMWQSPPMEVDHKATVGTS